jgi:hypothetical protein
VSLGRNRARPRCTVRAWPTASASTACAALARPSSAGLCNARQRHCPAAALLGEPTAARHRRTGDGGERRLTGVETAARSPRRRCRRRRRHGGRGARRAVGTCGASCRDSRRVAAMRQRRAAARARCGARRLTSGAHSSMIFELKFTPNENSSK